MAEEPTSSEPVLDPCRLALRVAVATSTLTAAVGATLYSYWSVPSTWLVAGAALQGLVVGCHLPAIPRRRASAVV